MRGLSEVLLKFTSEDRDDFVYGFFSAVIVISLLLYHQYGYDFCYIHEGKIPFVPVVGNTVSWFSAITMSVLFMSFYRLTATYISIIDRLKYTGMCCLFAFEVNDIIWLTKAYAVYGFIYDRDWYTGLVLLFMSAFYFKRFWKKMNPRVTNVTLILLIPWALHSFFTLNIHVLRPLGFDWLQSLIMTRQVTWSVWFAPFISLALTSKKV